MGFIGSLTTIGFGILWIIITSSMASSMRDPFGMSSDFGMTSGFGVPEPIETVASIFPIFGVFIIIAGIASAVYNYQNATGKDRYSIIDIVDKTEEGDAADRWVKDAINVETPWEAPQNEPFVPLPAGRFCTSCGHVLAQDYDFCPGCGKSLRG